MRTTEEPTGVGTILFRYPNRKDAYLMFYSLPLLGGGSEAPSIVLTPETDKSAEDLKTEKIYNTVLPAYDRLLMRCAKRPILFDGSDEKNIGRVSTETEMDIEQLEVNERLKLGMKLMSLSGFTEAAVEEVGPLSEIKTP